MSTFPQQGSLLDHMHTYVQIKTIHPNKFKARIQLDKLTQDANKTCGPFFLGNG